MPRTTRKSRAATKKATKSKQSLRKPGPAVLSKNLPQSKIAAKNAEEEIPSTTSSESEDNFVAEKHTPKQSKEEMTALCKRTCADDSDTPKTISHNSNENAPPKPNKMPRRSTRAAAINKLSLYADSDDDSSSVAADSCDEDACVVQKSKTSTKRDNSKAFKGASKKGSLAGDKGILGEDNKPPRNSGKLLKISTTTPIRGGAMLRKPSPASSSIKEITSTMWQPNASDWRIEGVMDY